MKKHFLPLFFALALAGCGDSSKPIKPEDMNSGYIHFAANLLLDDIVRKGDASEYNQLAPENVLNPFMMLDADAMLEDFRRDYMSAEDHYYRLRGKGTVIRGKVDRVDTGAQEVIFTRTDSSRKPPFTGRLRLSLDRDIYTRTALPQLEPGETGTFICREYRPVHDFRNESRHDVEIRLIGCQEANDYFDGIQASIVTRLREIYSGREDVNQQMADRLATLYLAGQSLAPDSACLRGSFLTCAVNLIDELAGRYKETNSSHIGTIRINPDKETSRRFDRIKSEPAIRPDDAGLSPSGEKITADPQQVDPLRQSAAGARR